MNEKTIDKIMMFLNYYDADNGERYYDLEGLRNELEDHIIGIIAEHKKRGIKINRTFLDMLEEVK